MWDSISKNFDLFCYKYVKYVCTKNKIQNVISKSFSAAASAYILALLLLAPIGYEFLGDSINSPLSLASDYTRLYCDYWIFINHH